MKRNNSKKLNRAVFLDRDGVINRAIVLDRKPYAQINFKKLKIKVKLDRKSMYFMGILKEII